MIYSHNQYITQLIIGFTIESTGITVANTIATAVNGAYLPAALATYLTTVWNAAQAVITFSITWDAFTNEFTIMGMGSMFKILPVSGHQPSILSQMGFATNSGSFISTTTSTANDRAMEAMITTNRKIS